MAAAKKKPKKSKAVSSPEDDTVITIDGPGIEPFAAGPLEIPDEDGGVTIEFGQQLPEKINAKFDDNLAEFLDNIVLGQISTPLLEAIEQDERDRSEWIQQRSDGLELLGMKVEKPGGANVGSSSTAVPGQSTVRDALLAEAVDRFQANAFAELCPAVGPCKVTNYADETVDDDKLAEDFEKDFNYYLTGSGGPDTATEYYPDTNKMLWWTGYASGMFKKVYRCPLRNRPVSESVDGSDLIVPSNATDLHNAGRITHQINMNHVTLKQMQLQGAYRDVTLTAPTPQPNALQNKEADIVGMNANPQRPEDQDYTIYECYCNLDIPGFEHERDGKPTGLPVPYRVVIDKDSRTVLEIRRNWRELSDEDAKTKLPQAKIPFVLFPYAMGLGFYGTGLLHRLGNYTMALTAMLRECIDAGMFASFPGFLFAKPMGRQLQNEFRVPPGGGAPIDVSAVGGNINNAVMPLPYKDVSTAMVALMEQTRQNAARYGGTAEGPTGEGVMNAPVGSVLAAIDQATRIEGGVHKGLYAAQRQELILFRELFEEDPEAMFRGNDRPAMGRIPMDADDQAREAARQKRLERFKKALKKCNLTPASDPNIPSHMHRMAKANTYLQTAIALQSLPPQGLFNMQAVVRRWAAMVKIDDVENDFAPAQGPPQLPPPNPLAVAKLQIDDKNAETRRMDVILKHQGTDKKLQTDKEIEATKLAMQHSNALDQANGQPDPLQHRALDLKEQQIQDARDKTLIDAHQRDKELNSKEAIKAMDIVQASYVHPESTPVANQEMARMSNIIAPAEKNNEPLVPPMSGGGRVPDPEPTPEELEAAYQAHLSRILTDYVRDYKSRIH